MDFRINLISYIITHYPKQIAQLLNKNGVVVDATNFSIKELSDATLVGLTTSKKFNDDFVDFSQKLNLNPSFFENNGYSSASGDWIGQAIGSFTELATLNTKNKQFQGSIDAQNLNNATSLEIANIGLETEKLRLASAQAGLGNASSGKSGSTTLYIALGIGGALILGLTIFLVTRKKG
jgi:hypothetical protein